MAYLLSLCVIISTLVSAALAVEPPKNPYLADSPWPMSHRNPYNQHSSDLPGPTKVGKVNQLDGARFAVAITLNVSAPYPDGKRAIWGSSKKEVFKLDGNGTAWDYYDYVDKESSEGLSGHISGAYTVLDKDGVFFVPHGSTIEAFTDAKDKAASKIVLRSTFSIPSSTLASAEEYIVGLNLTYDGNLAFVTDLGLVGVLSRDFKGLTTYRIPDSEKVSNSLAVDEEHGIFVVTEKKMYRVQWEKGTLSMRWSVPYLSTAGTLPGRLGPGSGTSPVLMGSGTDDKLVAIADGQELMRFVLYWRDAIPSDWKGLSGKDRRIAAEVPIQFGRPELTRSVTEQAFVVRGYEAAVVNNDYGPRPTSGISNYLTILKSHQIAPKGVEKFVWDPVTRKLNIAWANKTVSCPNGIPTMSAATNLFYCVGAYQGNWTFEALDWSTGAVSFRKVLGTKNIWNSFYAAAEIGPDGTLLSGALSGFLKASP